MVIIAGIDLAWSGRRPTGVCFLEVSNSSQRLIELSCSAPTADATAIHEMLAALGPDVIAGIDGPLITGPGRRAEADLARVYGRQGVYAYAARLDFLERHGISEGPKLGALLRANGWNLDPLAAHAGASGRHAFEVFPHATIVSLLGAPRALKYKKGTRAARLGPLGEFQAMLRAYAERDLPCLLGPSAWGILCTPIEMQSGASLKALEDQLDAMACAIAAFHVWRFGSDGLSIFGDAANGYIAVPKPVTSSPALSSP